MGSLFLHGLRTLGSRGHCSLSKLRLVRYLKIYLSIEGINLGPTHAGLT